MAPSPIRGPRLLPGALLLRRDARTLQVGTSPGVPVRDRPGLARVLRLLDGSLPLPVLAELVARDVPEFADDLHAVLRELGAAGAVLDPVSAPPSPRVAVRHDRSTPDFAALLIDALGPVPAEPDLEILVSAGEPGRSTVEHLVGAGIAHLPVVLDERRVRIGPLVVPGATPCLGCHDAHRAAADPGWRALIPQFERGRLLACGLAPGVLLRAAAEVLHQVHCLRNGARPPALGRVVSVTSPHDVPEVEDVPFATDCACRLLAA